MTQPPSSAPETALRSSWRSSPARKYLQTPSNRATSVLQAPCFELIQLEQSATVGTTYMQEHGVAAIPVDNFLLGMKTFWNEILAMDIEFGEQTKTHWPADFKTENCTACDMYFMLPTVGTHPLPPRDAGRITQPVAASPLEPESWGSLVNNTLNWTSTITLCSRLPGEQTEGYKGTRRLVWGQDLRFWVVQR